MRTHPILYQLSIAACAVFVSLAAAVAAARYAGFEFVSVQSSSMSPTIRKGDAVLIRKSGYAVRIGDVVSFRSPADHSMLVTHRVTALRNDGALVITKGDNVRTADPAIPASHVVGKVVASMSLAGYILDAVRRPVGLALVIYLPVLGIILNEVNRLKRYYGARYSLHGYRRSVSRPSQKLAWRST